MAPPHQKRPSITNWFSSLRRPPKNKKNGGGGGIIGSSGSFGNKPQLQRSCFDLSSSATATAIDSNVVVSNSRSSSTFYIAQPQPKSTSTPPAEATTPVAEDDDRRRLIRDDSGSSSVSQLCARCFCNLGSSRSVSDSPPPTTKHQQQQACAGKPPPKPRSPSLTPYTSVASYNSAEIPAVSTLTSETVTASDVSRTAELIRLPSTEPHTQLLCKRAEQTNRTTTTTTHTMIISRPVELLLNERGEIISRRPQQLTRNRRSNSLGCVLDEEEVGGGGIDNGALEIDTDGGQSSVLSSPLSTGEEGESNDLRFIDDSSNSQSESERNSVNNNNNNNNNSNNHNNNNTNNSNSKKNHNQNDNNNHMNLCDICRTVIERNRNNAEQSANVVILRRPQQQQQQQQIKDELCEVVSEMEALDVPEDCKHSNKDKQMSIGRKKFNMDPKKGIEYLVENRLLLHNAQDVAQFLHKGEGLNKTAIGDYLGEKNDFNENVLKKFVELHDFTNLILVQALRQFLWSFRLPGEAQKIDRMMECFAQRYCQLNPDIFTNTDTCYVLSFAIIMLNTSLHNPSVKDKPTVEQFISMNRGINNGGDLARGLLESLYESIRTEPFKIPQDDGNDLMHTFFNPDKEGWLWKQGGRYKSWKRRWFILNDNCLYYFEYTTDKEPRGIIPLENISVREIHDRSKPHCFELFATGGADIIKACKTDSEGKVVEGKHTVYRMSAATEEDQQEWIKRLTQSISHNPFYDILVQRKKKALSKS
ncbi:uncharacterized protein LOC115625861 isoform X1 [Scaptodrosophila lebanonensis]|uniref:Uncharacterized protein LOC115625861 isoform X1 n=1 Tax=Drosophila lebanonensis TaxID=7225 RepID=A0A6J2TLK6_DROLE|nr:uncharacterized protein LOC115625861 isoform X1 [Scaptodrosophila lebanonensis]